MPSPRIRTAILTAPQAWGKTRNAAALCREHKCTAIVDDWHPRMSLTPNALHLTNVHPADLQAFAAQSVTLISRGW